MYLALTAPADGAPQWGTEWISDFERVMTLDTPDNVEEDVPHFSLITGKLVYAEQSRPMRMGPRTTIEYDEGDQAVVKSETQVAVREDGTVAVMGVRSLAGEKLRGRSWRGLEIGEDRKEAAEVEIGRDGVARGYRDGDKRN